MERQSLGVGDRVPAGGAVITFAQRQTTAHRNRQARADMVQLLARARAVLARWGKLHADSVRIGILQEIADTGVIDAEIEACRKVVEQADRVCADIDRLSLASRDE